MARTAVGVKHNALSVVAENEVATARGQRRIATLQPLFLLVPCDVQLGGVSIPCDIPTPPPLIDPPPKIGPGRQAGNIREGFLPRTP